MNSLVEQGSELQPSVASRCVTCGAVRPGPFCPSCGQRDLAGRHTLKGFARGALSRVVGQEGVIHTAWQLTVRPGSVVRDYLAGRTVRYMHPVSYLLLAAAVFAVVGRALGGFIGEFEQLLALLIIPFIAAWSRAFFWRGPYNYAEHLILVLYLSAHVLVVLALLYFGTLAVPQRFTSTYATVSLGVGIAYFVWAYGRTFARRPWLAGLAAVLAVVFGTAVWAGTLLALLPLFRR